MKPTNRNCFNLNRARFYIIRILFFIEWCLFKKCVINKDSWRSTNANYLFTELILYFQDLLFFHKNGIKRQMFQKSLKTFELKKTRVQIRILLDWFVFELRHIFKNNICASEVTFILSSSACNKQSCIVKWCLLTVYHLIVWFWFV